VSTKSIFLDRDGVINHEIGYLYKPKDFVFIDGVFEASRHFIDLGYKIIIITNQSGISRGYYQEKDFHKLTRWMLDQFKINSIVIHDVFFCPHGPNDDCVCRKPKPGMILDAAKKHNINLKDSWLIGDKEVDIEAANNAGICNTIIVKSGHSIDELNTNAKYVCSSIKDSIRRIT